MVTKVQRLILKAKFIMGRMVRANFTGYTEAKKYLGRLLTPPSLKLRRRF